MESFLFQVNGLDIEAQFHEKDRDGIFLPLLRKLTGLQAEKGKRLIVFLAAPPAAGKSTLCCYLEKLSREYEDITPVQCAGLDGFHYPQKYLDSHSILKNGMFIPLARVKGAPESFDVKALAAKIDEARAGDTYFPVYSRRLHDPVADALPITEKILIIEGNWLLLDETCWKKLSCDYSVFLKCGDESQLERIVKRKMMGGYSEKDARRMVRENDWPNIQRCMAHSRPGNMNLIINLHGYWEEI